MFCNEITGLICLMENDEVRLGINQELWILYTLHVLYLPNYDYFPVYIIERCRAFKAVILPITLLPIYHLSVQLRHIHVTESHMPKCLGVWRCTFMYIYEHLTPKNFSTCNPEIPQSRNQIHTIRPVHKWERIDMDRH